MRLLIVDDEIEFARYVATVASGLGFDVETVAHAKNFQESYDRVEPDVVLLDMVMPDMDGIELVTWLSERGSTVHLLIATGYNPKYAEMAEVLGAQSSFRSITKLQKPLRAAELRKVLRAFQRA
jgi:two-component system response regulator HydG